jgi:hypothetical protein
MVWLAILLVGILLMAGILRARGFGVLGNSTSSTSGKNRASAVLDIGILVFREGLECILVLAAVTASLRGREGKYQRPVSASGNGTARDSRSAGGDELVLSQAVLDGVDFASQPAQAGAAGA